MTQDVGHHNGLKAAYLEREAARKKRDTSGVDAFVAWAKINAPATYQKLQQEERGAKNDDAYERAHLDDPAALAEWDDLSAWVEQRLQQQHQVEHDLLGIAPGSTKRDIKNAYRRKARKLHPDVGGDEEAFKQLHAAYRKVLAAARA